MNVQEELNECLEKFKNSHLPVTLRSAKILENELNNILLVGASQDVINDVFYFEVDYDGKFNIQQIPGSVLDWKNKGAVDENW